MSYVADYDMYAKNGIGRPVPVLWRIVALRELVEYTPLDRGVNGKVVCMSVLIYTLVIVIFSSFVVVYNPEGIFSSFGGSPKEIDVFSQTYLDESCRNLGTLTTSKEYYRNSLLQRYSSSSTNTQRHEGKLVLIAEKVDAKNSLTCKNVVKDLVNERINRLAAGFVETCASFESCFDVMQNEPVLVHGMDLLLDLAGKPPNAALHKGYWTKTMWYNSYAIETPYAGNFFEDGLDLGDCPKGNPENYTIEDPFDANSVIEFVGHSRFMVTVNWNASKSAGHMVWDFLLNSTFVAKYQSQGYSLLTRLNNSPELAGKMGFYESSWEKCSKSIANVELSKSIIESVRTKFEANPNWEPSYMSQRDVTQMELMSDAERVEASKAMLKVEFYELPKLFDGRFESEVCGNYIDLIGPFVCKRTEYNSVLESLSLAFGNTSIIYVFVVFIARLFRE